jgi:hypothetical protein
MTCPGPLQVRGSTNGKDGLTALSDLAMPGQAILAAVGQADSVVYSDVIV